MSVILSVFMAGGLELSPSFAETTAVLETPQQCQAYLDAEKVRWLRTPENELMREAPGALLIKVPKIKLARSYQCTDVGTL